MACDTVSISSDDDIPLKVVGESHAPITSASLKLQSLQHCDFCEEVFLNKYDALIHNAKHIIIPLIKRQLHQCPLCLFYFTSRYKLKHHTRNKHRNDVKLNNEDVNLKNDVSKGNNENKHNNENKEDKDKDNPKAVHKRNTENHVDIKNYKLVYEKINQETEKIVTVYESDDDDDLPLINGNLEGSVEEDDDYLPLVNGNLKRNGNKETDESTILLGNNILREALLKDVKVVIEKIALPNFQLELSVNQSKAPEFGFNVKSNEKPPKIEPKVTEDNHFKIEKAKTNKPLSIETKAEAYKPLSIETKAKANKPLSIETKAKANKPLSIETKAKANKPLSIETKAKANKPLSIETKAKANKPLHIETNAKSNIPLPMETKADNKPLHIETKAKVDISPPKVKIRNRLRFEDDDDDDEIDDICDDAVMKDLTTDCIVDMNIFDEPWFDELAKSISNDDINDDMIITIDDDDIPGDGGEEMDAVEYSSSIHHDELIKPGVYRCKKCQQMFPTRFNQIQHEMSHMHIRKPRPVLCEHCDRFIANKKALKDHITSKHLTHYKPRTFKACSKCGLKYNSYDRHLENYHNYLRCHLCNEAFETEIDRLNHIRGHLVKIKCGQCGFVASEIEINQHKTRFHKPFVVSTDFNLCDVCCLFLKSKQNTQYVFGETVSKLGTRFDCEHCGNKFFHVTKVRRSVKGRPNDRFQFEKERERKKVLTNTERLKNIQQRLKMINRLSRF